MSTSDPLTQASPTDQAHAVMLHTLTMQRQSYLADGPPDASVRRNRIDRMIALVVDNAHEFIEAIVADFGTRSRTSTIVTEVFGIIPEIENTRKHVAPWMKPTRIMRTSRLFGLRGEVQPTPKGVVGIIGPWNFPLNLVALPAATALAAGNRVMIKMSEITPRTAELMATLAPKYFDATELEVIIGGAEVAEAFAALPFDHLFFTGSPGVGAKVQRAAAQNLVPVTLELGGKNPVVVAPDADLQRAAMRIAKGRMINGGQVCVCPDYVFVPRGRTDAFVDAVRETFRSTFPTILSNEDYCSSVNEANYDRVLALIEDARTKGAHVEAVGPENESLPDRAARKIAPTIVQNISDDMRIAHEEVFGPVLAIFDYSDLPEVIDYVNARPSPLVAYWYGPDSRDFRTFVRSTRSGGVARNDFGVHMSSSDAPFGGIGNSGMGAYHGKAGFDTFSHYRSVVGTDLPFSLAGLSTPPFRDRDVKVSNALLGVVRRRTHRRINRFRSHS